MHVHILIALLSLLFMKVTTAQEEASYTIAGYGTSASLTLILPDFFLLVNVTNSFVLHLAGSTCLPNVKVYVGTKELKLFCKAPLGNHYIILEPGQLGMLKISNLRGTTTATVWPYFTLINQNGETTLDAVNSRVYPTGYITSHRDLTKQFEPGLDSQLTLGYLEGADSMTIEFVTFKIGTSPRCSTTTSQVNVNTFRIINGTSNMRLYTCGNINHPPSSYVISAAYLSALRFRFTTNSNRNDGFLIKYSVRPLNGSSIPTGLATSTTEIQNTPITVTESQGTSEQKVTTDTNQKRTSTIITAAVAGPVGLIIVAVLVVVTVLLVRRNRQRKPQTDPPKKEDHSSTDKQPNRMNSISGLYSVIDLPEITPNGTLRVLPSSPTVRSSHMYAEVDLLHNGVVLIEGQQRLAEGNHYVEVDQIQQTTKLQSADGHVAERTDGTNDEYFTLEPPEMQSETETNSEDGSLEMESDRGGKREVVNYAQVKKKVSMVDNELYQSS